MNQSCISCQLLNTDYFTLVFKFPLCIAVLVSMSWFGLVFLVLFILCSFKCVIDKLLSWRQRYKKQKREGKIMNLTLCPKHEHTSQWTPGSIWFHIHALLGGCLFALTVGAEECSMSLNCLNLYKMEVFSGITFLISSQPDLFTVVTSYLYRICAASSETPLGLKRRIILKTNKRGSNCSLL